MIAMGYLNETTERDGTPSYYAYSRGFMYYLRMKPLDMDTWSLLSASEKKLKCIFGMVYPKFSEVTLRDIEGPDAEHAKTIISEAHRETGFRWDPTTEKFLKSARAYLENPSVLDTIAITFVISRITHNWDRRFARFFNDDSTWKNKLELIAEVRNPVAHMHEASIAEDKMACCKRYMEELMELEV